MKPPGAPWEMIAVLIKWRMTDKNHMGLYKQVHSYIFFHGQDYFVHVKAVFELFPVVKDSVTKF